MASFPLAYFGNIAYYKTIVVSSNLAFNITEKYQKQSYRNRCDLVCSNGRISLSVPVVKTKGSQSSTKDIAISYAEDWQKNHWNTIQSAYGKSPFFEFYADDIEKLVFSQHKLLYELNFAIFKQSLKWLDADFSVPIDNDGGNISLNTMQLLSKNGNVKLNHQKYYQVFEEKFGFIENLSILDLIFNEGPKSQLIVFQ